MGSKDAVTLLNNVRDNLSEPLSAADMLISTAGSNFTNSYLLECLNKAKDRVWEIIKEAREDFFQTADTITINATTKEYALASNFRSIVGLKCTTGGYETLKLRRVDQGTREFQERDALPADGSQNGGELIYTIIAQSKIKFADFPPASLTLSYDYIRILADYTLSGSSTSDVDDEHREFMEAYATYKALLKNPEDKRLMGFKSDLARLEPNVARSVKIRNQRESVHVAPFSI